MTIVTTRLSLPEDGRSDRRRLELQPQTVFRPTALLLWGTAEETRVRDLFVGSDSQLLSTLPGCLFESELSHAEFEALFQKRHPHDGMPIIDAAGIRQLGLIFRLSLDTLTPDRALAIDIEGPFSHGALLGEFPDDCSSSDFGDDETVFIAAAPEELR